MTTETDVVWEKQTLLTNTTFLNKGKVKFLQIKQNTIKNKPLYDKSSAKKF